MRCDLHVHTLYSGAVNLPLLRHVSRECYSRPSEVYETARARGMDLVAITDHDTIDGAVLLADRPDFIVGEEVTCELPGGRRLHVGVWGLNERQHETIAVRRRDAEALFAYLHEQGLPAALNHPFSPMTGSRSSQDIRCGLAGLPLVEGLNSMMPAVSNHFATRAAAAARRGTIGGSDAHAIGSVARAYTEVPGARNRDEFLAGLRAGAGVARGASGSYGRLTSDVVHVFLGTVVEVSGEVRRDLRRIARAARLALVVPVLPLLPLITLVNFTRERVGARRIQLAFELDEPAAEAALAES